MYQPISLLLTYKNKRRNFDDKRNQDEMEIYTKTGGWLKKKNIKKYITYKNFRIKIEKDMKGGNRILDLGSTNN